MVDEKTTASEVRFALDESLDDSCDLLGSEAFVTLKGVRLDGEPAPEGSLTRDDDGQVLGVRLGMIRPDKPRRVEFDYDLPKEVDVADDMPVVLKAQVVRRATEAVKARAS